LKEELSYNLGVSNKKRLGDSMADRERADESVKRQAERKRGISPTYISPASKQTSKLLNPRSSHPER
jgi:hypothetical protein